MGILLAALLTAQTADAATTVHLLNRPGYHEANRLLPSTPSGIVAVKASMTSATAVTAWKIRKAHPKMAVLLFTVSAASGSVAAWHNARLMHR